uniref:Uncharacterized protein n=1 Tax=Candidozyma auris TaxID=498019 RepID=A0A0L0P151_CANAR
MMDEIEVTTAVERGMGDYFLGDWLRCWRVLREFGTVGRRLVVWLGGRKWVQNASDERATSERRQLT